MASEPGRGQHGLGEHSLATTNGSNHTARPRTGRLRRIRALLAAALLGGVTGLVALIVVTATRNGGRLAQFEPATFYANQTKWSAAGLTDYRLVVRVTGRQAAEYFVEVRGGQIQQATRDGTPLRQRRTMGTWSVPGMFTTIQSDVTNLEKHRDGRADRQTPQVLLRGQFDTDLGYPIRYHRTEMQKWGTNVEVSWEVTLFELLDSRG
jgi:hypothetical protein